ncbi:rhodanese-like domain-containing protein [bacterium]|nr:rhodanese-like domain-containing protein [bacterium]MCI0601431.1 rhodanese-like domain-containing protein [bacterium]
MSAEPTIKTIDRDELEKKIESGEHFFLVETLPEEKYRKAHLPGALNLPPDRLRELAPFILPDKNALIIVYCASPT